MCSRPILRQPNYEQQFFLATDASAYGVGAVLLQEGELNPRTKKPTQHPIAYYSNTFTPTERNYDIYERELLAVIKALQHWRPHLAATEEPVIVLTDHANLTFWKNPKSVNRRVARWFAILQDYNLQIKHVPGKLHAAADMLSRPPSEDKGEKDNADLTLLPPQIFVRTTDSPWDQLLQDIIETQHRHRPLMEDWKRSKEVAQDDQEMYTRDGKIVVPPDESLKRRILRRNHDTPTRGHPGRDRTIDLLERHFWWPGLRKWTEEYVRGCATCQQNKICTHPLRIPSFRISTKEGTLPFQTVAMDLITNLPNSHGHDAILTIVDHGCTRAAIFLPCKTTITGEGVATLYHENVYRWFGLPAKIISDRDPRFTSHFAKALCQRLGIEQNISTAFHPQTDGVSERKNQWVELFLRHLTSDQQDDWSEWLTVATAVHNHYENATTRVAPIEALLGYLPRLDYSGPPSMNERAEERTITAHQKRVQAKEAINRWAGERPKAKLHAGDRVWLEGKNLKLPYQNLKLAPKRYGPFKISRVISPVAYQLDLPPSWTIHNVFHAGLLSPYHETKQYGANFPRPPPDVIDGEEEYEVEAIRNHRHFGKRRTLQYLIKWKGYPEADNTWENHGDVFAGQLIRQYHQTHPLRDKRKTSSRRVSINSIPTQWPLPLAPHLLSTSMSKSNTPSQFPLPTPNTSRSVWTEHPLPTPAALLLPPPPSSTTRLEQRSLAKSRSTPSLPSTSFLWEMENPSTSKSPWPDKPHERLPNTSRAPRLDSGPRPTTYSDWSKRLGMQLDDMQRSSRCSLTSLPTYDQATTPPDSQSEGEVVSPQKRERSPPPTAGRRMTIASRASSFLARMGTRWWPRTSNAPRKAPMHWEALGDQPTHSTPMNYTPPPPTIARPCLTPFPHGSSPSSPLTLRPTPSSSKKRSALMTGASSPRSSGITNARCAPRASLMRSPASSPRRTTFSRRFGSLTIASHEPTPVFDWHAARDLTPTSSRTTRRAALGDTPYAGVRSSKARVGLSSSRRVMIPASRRSGPSAITCVSNGLTGGTGSGFIDGELSLW